MSYYDHSKFLDRNFLAMRQSLFHFKFILCCQWTEMLTQDVKSDIRTLNFRSDVTHMPPLKTPNEVQRKSLFDVNVKNKRNYE